MTHENVSWMKDRNGLILEYGDTVYLKSYWSKMYPFTVIGFTDKFVVCLCGSTVFYRKSSNVVKITNYKTWKHY